MSAKSRQSSTWDAIIELILCKPCVWEHLAYIIDDKSWNAQNPINLNEII